MPQKKSPTVNKTENEADDLMRKSSTRTTNTDLGNGYVYVEKSITKNMGDYNSVRVAIGITVPVGATDEQLRMAKVTVRKTNEIVEKIIEQEVNILMEE